MMALTREEFFDYIKIDPWEILDNPDTYSPATAHYLKRFDKHGQKRFFLSWNWAAFFFTCSWMFYRKMFMLALFIYFFTIISIAIWGVFKDFIIGPVIFFILFLLYISSWVFPLFSDSLYISHIKGLKEKGKRPKRRPISWLGGIAYYLMSYIGGIFLLGGMIMLLENWVKPTLLS